MILGQVFLGFLAETDPRDPLDRRGPSRTSISTRNQPRRPLLMPFCGSEKPRQIAFRYPDFARNQSARISFLSVDNQDCFRVCGIEQNTLKQKRERNNPAPARAGLDKSRATKV